ncbi:MAG: polyprenol monophosphomannose synthase [Candidatus Aenigmatarchaeota archaeon]
MIEVSVIIPTYNEKDNVKRLLPEIFSTFSKNNIRGEVIIVDDNSPDGTAEVVKKMEKRFQVHVVKRRGKLGLSSAVLRGFKEAKGDILGVMDADFSHPVNKIPYMIKALKTNDIVIGSRYVPGGGIKNWPLKRKIVSKGATLLAAPVTNIKDPMSGFFFLRKSVIKGVKLNPRGYKIGLEILVKGKYEKAKEISYVFKDRAEGDSKLGIDEMVDYMVHVAGLYWHLAKKEFTD